MMDNHNNQDPNSGTRNQLRHRTAIKPINTQRRMSLIVTLISLTLISSVSWLRSVDGALQLITPQQIVVGHPENIAVIYSTDEADRRSYFGENPLTETAVGSGPGSAGSVPGPGSGPSDDSDSSSSVGLISSDSQVVQIRVYSELQDTGGGSRPLFETNITSLANNVPQLVPIMVSADSSVVGIRNVIITVTNYDYSPSVAVDGELGNRPPSSSGSLATDGPTRVETLRREVRLSHQSGFPILQTDKPIYTPRDVVRIRSLKLNDRLQPERGSRMKLRIINPRQVIVEEVKFNENKLFVDHTFDFPPAPTLGVWRALLMYGPDFAFNTSLPFEVQQYVLPTFDVKLDIPKFILPSTQSINGSISVRYVYGKPVEGTATFNFRLHDPLIRKQRTIGRTHLKSLDSTGRAEFSFQVGDIKDIGVWFPVIEGTRLVIEATVTESATLRKEKSSDKSSVFVSSPYRFSFTHTYHEYQPEIETWITITVSDANGVPAAGVPISVGVTDDKLKSKVLVITNQTASDGLYRSDAAGRVYAPMLVMDPKLRHVTVRVSTRDERYPSDEQATGEVVIHRQLSQPKEPFLALSHRKRSTFRVGDTFKSDLNIGYIRINMRDVYFLVLDSRGHIILASGLDQEGYISFRVTRPMIPLIRVVGVAYNKFNRKTLLADSVEVEVVEGSSCGLNVSYHHTESDPGTSATATGTTGSSEPTLTPSSFVTLHIAAPEQSLVSLIGIDEAVYALRRSHALTNDKFRRLLTTTGRRHSCGPGGGRDPLDVFANAGIAFLSTERLRSPGETLSGSHCDANIEVIRRRRRSVALESSMRSMLARYDDTRLRHCCRLGQLNDRQQRSCDARVEILRRYIPSDVSCSRVFLDCCVRTNEATTASSRTTMSSSAEQPPDVGRGGPSHTAPHGRPLDDFIHTADEQDIEDETLIRSDFRETWLFDIVDMAEGGHGPGPGIGGSGPGPGRREVTKSIALPHSITTWSIQSMSISERDGICINDTPLRVVAFQEFFLQVDAPYHVVQNEQIEIVATVFNYVNTSIATTLYIYGHEDICSEAAGPGEKSPRKRIHVPGNSAENVVFPVVPLRTGNFTIRIAALSHFLSDIVERVIHVLPQGILVEQDGLSFHLDPHNQQRRKKRSVQTADFKDEIDPDNGIQRTEVRVRPNKRPEFIVPNTQECIISAVGDRMASQSTATTSSLSEIDHLIRQPKGCGEQTMIYLAPTYFTARYLHTLDRLNGDLRYRSAGYIQHGYKREIEFRKSDGSFSGFPKAKSSLWLTAFVMKIFCQIRAAPFLTNEVFIDPMVIDSGLEWIMAQQNPTDGSFREINYVYHREMLGGLKGNIPMTSFVLIALHECSTPPVGEVRSLSDARELEVRSAIRRATDFLVGSQEDVIRTQNAYVLALLGYSLALGEISAESDPSTNANAANMSSSSGGSGSSSDPQQSNSLTVVHNLMKIGNFNEATNQLYWRNHHNIEATAYALMAIMTTGMRSSMDGQAIANWLNSQRSFTGAFETTQDTIVALEALTMYSEVQLRRSDTDAERTAGSPDIPRMILTCNVTEPQNRFKRSLHFDESNAQVTQRFKVDHADSLLKFDTEGNGLGLVSIKLRYNVLDDKPERLCKFITSVEVKEWIDRASKLDPGTGDEGGDQEDDNLGDEFFNEFNDDMLQEMGVRSALIQTGSGTNGGTGSGPGPANTGSNRRRSRRHIPLSWQRVRNNWSQRLSQFGVSMPLIGNYHRYNSVTSSGGNSVEARSGTSGSMSSDRQRTGSETADKSSDLTPLNNLSQKSIASLQNSRLVLEIKVCTYYSSNFNSEMSVIEFGILTGFQVNTDDLEEIRKTHGTLVTSYELKDRNLIFYLEYIPFGKQFCLQFRLIRIHQVSNLQAGVIRVYDYYRPEHACSQLYSPSRISDLIETKCLGEGQERVCRCAVDHKCPATSVLHEISDIATQDMQQARRRLESLICSDKYDFVWIGNVRQNNTKLGYRLLKIRIDHALRPGDSQQRGDVTWLGLNADCLPSGFQTGSRSMVMHKLVVFGRRRPEFSNSTTSTMPTDGRQPGPDAASNQIDETNNFHIDTLKRVTMLDRTSAMILIKNNPNHGPDDPQLVALTSYIEQKASRYGWKCPTG